MSHPPGHKYSVSVHVKKHPSRSERHGFHLLPKPHDAGKVWARRGSVKMVNGGGCNLLFVVGSGLFRCGIDECLVPDEKGRLFCGKSPSIVTPAVAQHLSVALRGSSARTLSDLVTGKG